MICGADLSELGPPELSWLCCQPWPRRQRRPIRLTAPFCFAWLVGGPRQQNVPMPVPCLSAGSRLGRLSRLCKSGVARWVLLSARLCKAWSRRSGRQATTMVRHSPKLFRLRWLKVVPISTSVVWNSISCVRSAFGTCGTTVIANVAATMIVLRVTTCALAPTARRANSVGSARHQLPLHNGSYLHVAARHQIGGAGSVWNGTITKATMDMSGWPTSAQCPFFRSRFAVW